jgi:hypothetical protein
MGDFFRDYWAPLGTLIAVTSAFISLIRGKYFKDSPRAKNIVVGVTMILGVISVAGTFYSQYQIVSAANADKAAANAEKVRHVMIREGIGRYIGVGQTIMNRFGLNEMPMPILDKVSWEGNVDDFLRTNLNDSYVARFHDNSGLAPISANGADPPHNYQYAAMFHEFHGGGFPSRTQIGLDGLPTKPSSSDLLPLAAVEKQEKFRSISH